MAIAHTLTTTQVTGSSAQDEKFIPFTAYIRLVPNLGTGKRRTFINNLEKRAIRAESDLDGTPNLTISSVLFTPQFGDMTGRLTVAGFITRLTSAGRQNSPPTTNIDLIHSGTDPGEVTDLIDGNVGGSLSAGQDPTANTDGDVEFIRDLLAAATTEFARSDIIAVEVSGVKYGIKKQGGRSFPIV